MDPPGPSPTLPPFPEPQVVPCLNCHSKKQCKFLSQNDGGDGLEGGRRNAKDASRGQHPLLDGEEQYGFILSLLPAICTQEGLGQPSLRHSRGSRQCRLHHESYLSSCFRSQIGGHHCPPTCLSVKSRPPSGIGRWHSELWGSVAMRLTQISD